MGNRIVNHRIGSWRFLQVFFSIDLAMWVGVFILYWLGLPVSFLWSWRLGSIIFLVQLAFSLTGLAYLSLYKMPQRK